jgi:YfiH family protein
VEAPIRGTRAPSAGSTSDPQRAAAAVEREGHWGWAGELGTAHFAFYGKATTGSEDSLLAALLRSGLELATMRQIHSARVLDASAGACGDGDALVTGATGLALRVATADCVPVLLASPAAIAAVHAGWRGLAEGILEAAVRRFPARGPISAVIGPAIGACCYEVGPEVATAVANRSASDEVIRRRDGRGRPHLDLRLAALLQLRCAGVEKVATHDACTRCEAERLWSYRREGKGAGRNLALIWRER